MLRNSNNVSMTSHMRFVKFRLKPEAMTLAWATYHPHCQRVLYQWDKVQVSVDTVPSLSFWTVLCENLYLLGMASS